MRLINKIEQTVSLAPLAMKLQNGDIVLSHLAVIYGNLLRSGGCDVSDDEVYGSMMGLNVGAELDQSEVMTAAATALACCFPERPEDEEPKKKADRK